MKWFYNMNIGKKLISSFIIVALLAGVVGTIGIININSINKDYTELYIDYGVSIGGLGAAGIDYHDMRATIRDIILSNDRLEQEQYITKLSDLDKRIEVSFVNFEKSIHSDEARTQFSTLKSMLEKYNVVREKAIGLALANQNEQALSTLIGDGTQYLVGLEESLNELFGDKKNNGLLMSHELTDQVKITVISMVIVVLVAMTIAVALGIFISRIIGVPVKNLVEAAEKIADGDLNVNINLDTKDEIGNLAMAFRRMGDNLNEVMGNINTASEQVASGTKQVSESSISLSQGATEQASSVEELTASIEEIASQTKMNADNSNEANILTETAKKNAIEGIIR